MAESRRRVHCVGSCAELDFCPGGRFYFELEQLEVLAVQVGAIPPVQVEIPIHGREAGKRNRGGQAADGGNCCLVDPARAGRVERPQVPGCSSCARRSMPRHLISRLPETPSADLSQQAGAHVKTLVQRVKGTRIKGVRLMGRGC